MTSHWILWDVITYPFPNLIPASFAPIAVHRHQHPVEGRVDDGYSGSGPLTGVGVHRPEGTWPCCHFLLQLMYSEDLGGGSGISAAFHFIAELRGEGQTPVETNQKWHLWYLINYLYYFNTKSAAFCGRRFQMNLLNIDQNFIDLCPKRWGMGDTKAPFVNLAVSKIFDFAKVLVRLS